jgi:hypothetical protein
MQRHLQQIRSTQPPRSKLPESVWEAAVELARQHGIYRVAQALRLDYMGLKKRLNGMVSQPPSAGRTAFVELVTTPSTVAECVIEFESATDGKMRIQWKSTAPPDWTSLLRAWRETAV